MEVKISCPKCSWEPEPDSKWYCSKCQKAVWNTFDTQGLCPVCSYQWEHTACLSCHKWSPHLDWYGLDGFIEELMKENKVTEKH